MEAISAAKSRYEERGTLGTGGMGVVRRVYDHVRRHEVALKLLTQATPEGLLSFKQEFRLLVERVHPNIVTLYELFQDEGGTWALTMELVEGARDFMDYVRPYRHLEKATREAAPDHSGNRAGVSQGADLVSHLSHPTTFDTVATLIVSDVSPSSRPQPTLSSGGTLTPKLVVSISERLIRAGQLNPTRLRQATLQLLEGLAFVHSAGLVHRDIKPSNVLVDRRGRVVVCDFGLVAVQGESHSAAGTLAYMAPEQFALNGTPASDVYAVGVMLYQALTGVLPIPRVEPTGAFLALKSEGNIVDPRDVAPNPDPLLADLAMEMLRTDPAARPTVPELRQRLAEGAGASQTPGGIEVLRASDEEVFVGRVPELEALRDAFDRSRLGATETVLVSGPSGVGKSALVGRVVSDLKVEHDALVLTGRCYQSESVPFKALDAIVDALAVYLSSLPDDTELALPEHTVALTELFPVLRRAPVVRRFVHGKDPLPRHLLLSLGKTALSEILHRLSRDRPVVLVIDDLQWGDLDSEPFLRELVEATASPGLLLLATHRTDSELEGVGEKTLPEQLLEQVRSRRSRVQALRVAPLNDSEVSELVTALAPGQASLQNLARIVAEASGSPFIVAELTRHRDRTNTAKGINGLIAERAADLPPEARALLEACSLAAWPQPLSLLANALNLDNPSQAVSILISKRLIRLVPSMEGERFGGLP